MKGVFIPLDPSLRIINVTLPDRDPQFTRATVGSRSRFSLLHPRGLGRGIAMVGVQQYPRGKMRINPRASVLYGNPLVGNIWVTGEQWDPETVKFVPSSVPPGVSAKSVVELIVDLVLEGIKIDA